MKNDRKKKIFSMNLLASIVFGTLELTYADFKEYQLPNDCKHPTVTYICPKTKSIICAYYNGKLEDRIFQLLVNEDKVQFLNCSSSEINGYKIQSLDQKDGSMQLSISPEKGIEHLFKARPRQNHQSEDQQQQVLDLSIEDLKTILNIEDVKQMELPQINKRVESNSFNPVKSSKKGPFFFLKKSCNISKTAGELLAPENKQIWKQQESQHTLLMSERDVWKFVGKDLYEDVWAPQFVLGERFIFLWYRTTGNLHVQYMVRDLEEERFYYPDEFIKKFFDKNVSISQVHQVYPFNDYHSFTMLATTSEGHKLYVFNLGEDWEYFKDIN